jgi:hypothetical protein
MNKQQALNSTQIIDAIRMAHANAEVELEHERLDPEQDAPARSRYAYAEGARDALKQLLDKVSADETEQPEAWATLNSLVRGAR